MSKGGFEYIIKGDKDRHNSQYEINDNIKFLNKELYDTKEALLHAQQEIEKH